MKLETYLNAMIKAYLIYWDSFVDFENIENKKTSRQFHTFRARILRMDADKNKWIKELLEISTQERLLNEIVEKDKRIDVLRAEHDFLMDGSKELKAELEEKDKRWESLGAEICVDCYKAYEVFDDDSNNN